MSSRALTPEQTLSLLAETPRRLTTLAEGLTAAQLRAALGQDEWSANDVLAHLRACADVWGGCIATIIAEDSPTLRAINPTTWIKRTNYPGLDFQPSLHAFATQRAELLAVLEPLPQEGWSRAATVTGAGKVLTRTVLSYAQWMAEHERPHIKQVARVISTLR